MSLKPRLTRLLLEALQCEADSFNVQILLGGLLLFKKVLSWMRQSLLYFFVWLMKKKMLVASLDIDKCTITCLYTNNSNILYLILSILSPQPPNRQILIDSQIISVLHQCANMFPLPHRLYYGTLLVLTYSLLYIAWAFLFRCILTNPRQWDCRIPRDCFPQAGWYFSPCVWSSPGSSGCSPPSQHWQQPNIRGRQHWYFGQCWPDWIQSAVCAVKWYAFIYTS